ncbi:MAG: hypothetical protein LRY51_07390 [Geovibrio sp.]|nr:hypothetical protein [Geovibrio sp.]
MPANGTALDSAKLQGKIPGTSIGNIVVQGDKHINNYILDGKSFTDETIFLTIESSGVVGIESVQVPLGFQCQVVFEGMIQRKSASKYEKIYIGTVFGVTSGNQHYCDSVLNSNKMYH